MGKAPGEISRIMESSSPPSLASAEKPPDAEVRCGQELFMEQMRIKYGKTLNPNELELKLNQIWSSLNDKQRQHYLDLKTCSKENISRRLNKHGKPVPKIAMSYDRESKEARKQEIFTESKHYVEAIGKALGISTSPAKPNALSPSIRSSQNPFTESVKTNLRRSDITSSIMSRRNRYAMSIPSVSEDIPIVHELPNIIKKETKPIRTIVKPLVVEKRNARSEFPTYIPAPKWKAPCSSEQTKSRNSNETPNSISSSPVSRHSGITKIFTKRKMIQYPQSFRRSVQIAPINDDPATKLSYEQAVDKFYEGLMQPLVCPFDEKPLGIYDMQKVGDIVENRMFPREFIGIL